MIFILFVFQEFVVLAYVVVLAIVVAGEHKTQRACRELPFVCPDAGRDEQTLEGAVELYDVFVLSVAELYFKGSAGCDDELPAFFVGVGSAVFARGDVVDVEDTAYAEGYGFVAVDVCEAASGVFFFGQVGELAIV